MFITFLLDVGGVASAPSLTVGFPPAVRQSFLGITVYAEQRISTNQKIEPVVA